ncbi:MAG: asparagine synthase (glutamine-hydrolyzing) [Promethearchaeota archaeon]
MCGICGFNFEDKALLRHMCDLIKHRGPDDAGYFTDSNVSIGMRRLSIIDLKTGQQPQHNENEDIWLVFNGEIYNFKDLRKRLENLGHQFYTNSDTEVIIHAYEEWGDLCVKRLRGQFAFCIYDFEKKILFLARDHMGLKPLYYYFDGNIFIFSSEIKCILAYNIKKEFNQEAFDYFISLKYVPNNLTLIKRVYKVPPSSYIKFDLIRKKLIIKQYWDIDFSITNNKPVKILAKELKKLLEDSIKIRLISDVPLGAFLSGGIDSSSVVGLMSKFMEEPVKTFSIGFEYGAPIDETKYSRLVAEYYNTDHTEIIVTSETLYELLPKLVWHLDDLIGDAAIVPVYLMAKYAREKMTVALTGDGADEVFAGYFHYRQQIKFEKYFPKPLIKLLNRYYNYIPSYNLRYIISLFKRSNNIDDRYIRSNIHIFDEEKMRVLPFRTKNIESFLKKELIGNLDDINRIARWDLKFQLPNQYNMKTDKMSMAASLEARIPFLDRKIVEWTAKIPSKYKLYGNIEKYILRLAVKDFLHPKILKRKKTGFGTPVNLWLKKGFKEISADILNKLRKRKNIINPKFVNITKRNRSNRLFEIIVWNLIMFELWYETFMESNGSKPLNF